MSVPRQHPASAPAVPGQSREAAQTCAVVLVAWNNRDYLLPCLRSLYGTGMETLSETVVVDNGSTDGSQDAVRAEFPDVRIIQNEGNVGLGKASNQGIEASTAPYVLLLNNDTLVDGRALDELVRFMDGHPDAGAVGGTLLNADGTFQSGYNRFPTLLEELLIATGIGRTIQPAYPAKRGRGGASAVDWITSACLLVRRAALDKVGLLDESYFIYGDETDIQYRLAAAGWRVYLLPDVETIHFGGRSLDRWRRRRLVYRGKMLFFRKNYGEGWAVALRALLGAVTLGKVVAWSAAWVVKPWRVRAVRELRSNVDVLRLCRHLD